MPKKDTKLQKLSENIYIAVEEMRGLGIEGLDRIFMEEYLQQAEELTDARQQSKVRHLLKDIVGIVFWNFPMASLHMMQSKESFLSYVQMNYRVCW